MTDRHIFEEVPDGRLLAVRNWKHRDHEDDALIAVPLEPEQIDRYRELKRKGMDDAQIFDELFAVPIDPRVSISIDQLSKKQLMMLLRQVVGDDIPTLDRVTREDLVKLVRTLCKATDRCEAYLV
ncbi:MAG: hypothetical protein R3200_03980 [Xanthomonadales bacterium]|nr:hypothetical protein [Xanthomonadales bacterium]